MKVLTTAPTSLRYEPATFLGEVRRLARWNEDAGIEGMLIYTDNALIDPWTVAHVLMSEGSGRLRPLVAVQPLYMTPYAAARMISSLAFLHGRAMDLNMVAGGFVKDLQQLGDDTEHDARYERLIEYTQILQALLSGDNVTFEGAYYRVSNLRLSPALPPELMPEIYLSGASPACVEASAALRAVRFSYTKPPADLEPQAPLPGAGHLGLRIGIIARKTAEEAWREALGRFPPDRRGQLAHRIARGTTDSIWHRQLSAYADELQNAQDGIYWLHPFRNYTTFCPYLVGTYEEVSSYLRRYEALGYSHLILDVAASEEDLAHTMTSIEASRAELVPVA